MKMPVILILFTLLSFKTYALDCDGAYSQIYEKNDIQKTISKTLEGKNLSADDKIIIESILNPLTRSNIGGSLNLLGDLEYSQFLNKLKNNLPLSTLEKEILQNLDQVKAISVYQELLYAPKIHPSLRGRSSPRAFSNKMIEQEKVEQIFEGARWAASAFNEQPWRYIVATKEDMTKYNALKSLLDEWNQAWAGDAPVLSIAIRKKTFSRNGKENAFSLHDLGMAQANIGFSAESLGVSVHPMAGFDATKAKSLLGIPEDFEPVTMMAMGYRGSANILPENLKSTELAARERKTLSTFVYQGSFGKTKNFNSPFPQVWKTKNYQPAANIIKNRASKRAFASDEISDEEIGELFEAARWAPSAFNEQPWSFVYVKKGDPDYEKFFQVVSEFNAPWAKDAPVLILGLGKKNFARNGKTNAFFQHDLGIAQGNLQLQAESMGLNARQMGGIYPDKAKVLLNVPDDYEAISIIAVGKKGKVENLPENYQGEDLAPRTRNNLSDILFNGSFPQ